MDIDTVLSKKDTNEFCVVYDDGHFTAITTVWACDRQKLQKTIQREGRDYFFDESEDDWEETIREYADTGFAEEVDIIFDDFDEFDTFLQNRDKRT